MLKLFRFGTRSLLVFMTLAALSIYGYRQWYEYYRSHVFITVVRPDEYGGEVVHEYRYRARLLYPGIVLKNESGDNDEWQVHRGPDELCLYAPPTAKLEVEIEPGGRDTEVGIVDNSSSIFRRQQITAFATRAISGRIIDSTTRLPIAGAIIGQMSDPEFDPFGSNSVQQANNYFNNSILSDSDGYFKIEWADESQLFVAMHPNYVLHSTQLEHGVDNLIAMRSGRQVHVLAVNRRTHQPIANACIAFTSRDFLDGESIRLLGRTDENGQYSFTVKPGMIGTEAIIATDNPQSSERFILRQVEPITVELSSDDELPFAPDLNTRYVTVTGNIDIAPEDCRAFKVFVTEIESNSNRAETRSSEPLLSDIQYKHGTGCFELRNVPDRDCRIVIARNGISMVSLPFNADRDHENLGCIELPVTGGLKGHVENEATIPASFREIIFHGGPFDEFITVRCDLHGAFEVKHLLPGMYEMRLDDPWFGCLIRQVDAVVQVLPGSIEYVDTSLRPLVEIDIHGSKVESLVGSIVQSGWRGPVPLEFPGRDRFAANAANPIVLSARHVPPGVYSCSFQLGSKEAYQSIHEKLLVNKSQSKPQLVTLQLRTLHLSFPENLLDQELLIISKEDYWKDVLPMPRSGPNSPATSRDTTIQLNLLRDRDIVSESRHGGELKELQIYVRPDALPNEIHVTFPNGRVCRGPITIHNDGLRCQLEPAEGVVTGN